MRHHTSGNAGSVMSLPRMAVKPHSTTQKCSCSQARVRSARAAGSVNRLSPRRRAAGSAGR